MHDFPLSGDWRLRNLKDGGECAGHLPGCTYTDLWRAGEIPDPYDERNEFALQWVARRDYCYYRSFDLPENFTHEDSVDLVLSGVDTLAEIRLNGHSFASTDNAHRTYRLPAKGYLRAGTNEIAITFHAPLTEVERLNAKRKVPQLAMCEPGASQLRKAISHFGWDWGPVLAGCGINGELHLEAYACRWNEVHVTQKHCDDSVLLNIAAHAEHGGAEMRCVVTAPDGTAYTHAALLHNSKANAQIQIENPALWWCNGLGEQPLYTICVQLLEGGEVHDSWERKIGLRTIALDTAPDKWGTQFRFWVNGVPIFAKGANWIPQDSMPGRQGTEQLAFLIQSAKDANMNMLRVWGGGYYESDGFYRLCDENGILVWQDCAFACALYPLDEAEYRAKLRAEIIDNVRRLRHHACLALWNGNNEIQSAARGYIGQKKLLATHNHFFFETLRQWIDDEDGVTPYWPGSPSNGDTPTKPNDYGRGDTHLWTVWHACLPIEAYRKIPTRFCSEYGVESFPAWETLKAIAKNADDMRLFSPVMLAHQKCRSGNAKMRYYILSKFQEPRDFCDFAMLSQILQAEAMRHAADFWRCNMGRCNGSLYWQFNDCWPTASWAGIDYFGRWKALQYRARHFNAPLSAIALLDGGLKNGAPVYVVNETREAFCGILRWRFVCLDGSKWKSGEIPVKAGSAQSTLLGRLKDCREYAPMPDLRNGALVLELCNEKGACVHKQHYLLTRDKDARLLPPEIDVTQVSEHDRRAYFTLMARHYARFVQLVIPGLDAPFSDNFFDISGGESITVSVPLPEDKTAHELADSLQIRSVADIPWQGTPLHDRMIQLGILLNPKTHRFRNYPQREWETEQ
ncbi:MAG: hypothetical protein LBJ12_01655 [Oscillospiraceae bacterium]|jgi:beta-mannosidase|nr:hypothetical protein [Oscillospiraceae bacterium]